MKRMILFLVVGSFCVNTNLRAMSVYNAMSKTVVGFGELIESSDNFPLIGKLTNMLPLGMIAIACREYPGQTIILCTGLLYYILSKNETVTSLCTTYKDTIFERLGIKWAYNVTCDETLFIFDGDDEDDAEDQIEIEDELLAGNDGDDRANKNAKQSPFAQAANNTSKIKFL